MDVRVGIQILPQRFQQALAQPLGLKPVSYTHLDVYKRQLPEGELAHVLVEILVGRCLNALNGAGEADGVQVSLQNGLLGVGTAQAEGAVDLAQLCLLYTSLPLRGSCRAKRD